MKKEIYSCQSVSIWANEAGLGWFSLPRTVFFFFLRMSFIHKILFSISFESQQQFSELNEVMLIEIRFNCIDCIIEQPKLCSMLCIMHVLWVSVGENQLWAKVISLTLIKNLGVLRWEQQNHFIVISRVREMGVYSYMRLSVVHLILSYMCSSNLFIHLI